MLGWVPLKTVYESDYGSLDSEEKGELDGDEVIEILDPTTGEVIEPDSVSFFLGLFTLAWRHTAVFSSFYKYIYICTTTQRQCCVIWVI